MVRPHLDQPWPSCHQWLGQWFPCTIFNRCWLWVKWHQFWMTSAFPWNKQDKTIYFLLDITISWQLLTKTNTPNTLTLAYWSHYRPDMSVTWTNVSLKEAKMWATPNTVSPSLTWGPRVTTASSLTTFPLRGAILTTCFGCCKTIFTFKDGTICALTLREKQSIIQHLICLFNQTRIEFSEHITMLSCSFFLLVPRTVTMSKTSRFWCTFWYCNKHL